MRCHTTASPAVRHGTRIALLAVLATTLVGLLGATSPASAQLGRDVATTAVVQFEDRSGRQSRLLEARATDAVALALADSKELLVTPATDVEREMRALGLTSPLSLTQAVRLGGRLDVDSVTTGQILRIGVNQSTGQASVRLQMMMINVEAQEPLDGALVEVETRAKPGWQGTEADALNEGLREAAEQAVARMLATRVPKGTIEAVVASGNCEVNLGAQDGIKPGMKMVVMRPMYIRDLEKVVMRTIGRVVVAEALADICYATPQAFVAPRTGDAVLRIYEPEAVRGPAVAKKQAKSFLAVAAGLALVGALVSIGAGGNFSSPGPTPVSYLAQTAPGDLEPVIRIKWPKPDRAFGHLLFRGENAGFPPDAPYLVEVSAAPNGEEEIPFLDDNPLFVDEQDRTITVAHLDESGEWVTDTVDCTWTHPPLTPGQAYFHRVRRVTRPLFPPGTNPPIAQGAGAIQRERAYQILTNTIDQSSDFPMISEPTKVMGPVTYMVPVQLVRPAADALPQNPEGPIDFEWSQTTGADEYMLEIFPVSDPGGLGQAVFRQTNIRPTGSGNIALTLRFARGDLAGNSVFFWRAGARNSLEATNHPSGQGIPHVGLANTEILGWVLSEMRSFETAAEPPPTPRLVKPGNVTELTPQPGRPGRPAEGTRPGAKPKGKRARGARRAVDAQPAAPPSPKLR
jgi:hypothetical protein